MIFPPSLWSVCPSVFQLQYQLILALTDYGERRCSYGLMLCGCRHWPHKHLLASLYLIILSSPPATFLKVSLDRWLLEVNAQLQWLPYLWTHHSTKSSFPALPSWGHICVFYQYPPSTREEKTILLNLCVVLPMVEILHFISLENPHIQAH